MSPRTLIPLAEVCLATPPGARPAGQLVAAAAGAQLTSIAVYAYSCANAGAAINKTAEIDERSAFGFMAIGASIP
jgi:hypothetical protein